MKKNWIWIIGIMVLPIILLSCSQDRQSTVSVLKSQGVSVDEAVMQENENSSAERYLPLILVQQIVPTPTFLVASETPVPYISPTPSFTPIPTSTNPPVSEIIVWKHLSSETGDLESPSLSLQQTASLILDVDLDGINDFVIGIRRNPGPSVVWYRRTAVGWNKYLVEDTPLDIEAGGDFYDIDQDGDFDIVFGGDASGNQVWWWENPYPNFDPATKWTRREIKNSGQNKHHDMVFGDFDGDSAVELAFWNQGAKKLFLAEIPSNPKSAQTWQYQEIYSWSTGLEHEGLTSADLDGDGLLDLIGGGRWFKYQGNYQFTPQMIDDGYRFARVAVGQLIEGGSPEVVFVPGDGVGKIRIYEANGSSWDGHDMLPFDIDHGHSLQIADMDKDGHKDVFVAEMRLNGENTDAKMLLLLGNGQGIFETTEISIGYGNHESKVADLDGNGTLDILGKPYNWETPRIDVWLNNAGGLELDDWERHVIDSEKPWRAVFIGAADLNGDQAQDIITGGWWYQNPGSLANAWQRKQIGTPLNNYAAIFDFDLDGDMDVLGTEGQGSEANSNFVWARNDGLGNFSILSNIDAGDGDFLQGVTVDQFSTGTGLEVGLSWHIEGKGIQLLSIPSNPSIEQWVLRKISTVSQDEALSSSDIDRDGDKDILLGTKWLRNSYPNWESFGISSVSGLPDRNRLSDINGDGRLDAVVGFEAVSQPEKVSWYEQGETATAEWEEHFIANVIGPMSLDVQDMDLDGDLDVVVGEHNIANPASASLFVFENVDGAGSQWQQHLVYKGDEHHDGAQVVDIDGDGDLDIISIGWSHGRVLLYENKAISRSDDQTSINTDTASLETTVLPSLFNTPTPISVPSDTPTPIPTLSNTDTLSKKTDRPTKRIEEDLLALYTFKEGHGKRISDLSTEGEPLSLYIQDISKVEWLPQGGIRIKDSVLVTSEEPATKIIEGMKTTNQISVEVWLIPESDAQNGPARIVSLSKDIYNRNFTLGQENGIFDFRLRTTERTENGRPSVSISNGIVQPGKLIHLVYTRDEEGLVKIFVNGSLATQDVVGGAFSNWNSDFPLILVNELSMDRPWLGDLHLVGIYNRALSGQEIIMNYRVGF